MPPETGAFQQEFSLEYGPHLYGIFAAFDDPAIHEIYCMKAAQVLWTTALLAYIFKRVDTEPGVFMGMFASEGAAKKFVQDKMQPVGAATDPISKKIDFSGSRKAGTSQLRKTFKGGSIQLLGSNAIWGVKSTTAHFVFVEEPDDSSENLANQGDSIKLLFERPKRVRKPKKILGGTPSVKGFSRVEQHIELSDKRVLPVACHDCGEKHVLDFDNVVCWQNEEPTGEPHPIFQYHRTELAVYACPKCGSVWDDFQRKENIRQTVADAIAVGDPYCGWVPTFPDRKIAGFTQLSELYSCLNGVGVVDMVESYLEAEHYAERGDDTKKIVFINSKLGRAYEYQDGREDAETLREQAKHDPLSQHKEKFVPEGGLQLTAGIDVQDNRLAIVIRAHGRDRRSFLIYAQEIFANVSTLNEKDPAWSELDKLIFSPYEHQSGKSIFIKSVSIDSGGHATDAVYDWVLKRQKKYPTVKIMAIKGSSSTANPPVFSHPSPSKALKHKNPEKLTKAEKKGVKLYFVGTNQAKDFIAGQMSLNSRGQNRFHFYSQDDMRSDYFDQLLGESKIPGKGGIKVWKPKSGAAVEFWDCEVYAEHAARALGIHSRTEREWDDIERVFKQSDLFADTTALIPKEGEAKPRERRKSNFKRRE